MKRQFNLFAVAMATILLAACTSTDDFFDDFDDQTQGQGVISGGATSAGNGTTTGDLTTFEIAVDSTSLSETETILADDEDYVQNNTFGSVIKIAYNGSSATVSGSVDGVTVTTNGAHVSVVSETKGVAYVLSGTTTDGSFKIQSSAKKFRDNVEWG